MGSLRSTLVKPKTYSRYLAAVSRFKGWLVQNCIPYPSSGPATDARLQEFIECIWEEGESKQVGNDLISGFILFSPSLKRTLVGAKRMMKAWSRVELPARAPPATALIVYAVAQWFMQAGFQDSAVLFLLGWHTWARSGELFAALVGEFALSDSAFTGTWALPLSKSGQRRGVQEVLTIDDPFIGLVVSRFVQGRSAQESISAVSPSVQRRRLDQALDALGLEPTFRWYSLRRGGASAALRNGRDMGWILNRGRWAAQDSARIYLNDGLAQLTMLSFSRSLKASLVARAVRLRPSWAPGFRAAAR